MGGAHPTYLRLETVLQELSGARGCSIEMLTGGRLLLEGAYGRQERQVTRPAWYIKCADEQQYGPLEQALKAADLEQLPYQFEKDTFQRGSLMVAFTLSSVCAGAWMLLLVLALLPVNNHNTRRRLVALYAVFYAVTQTVLLQMLTREIFEKQYRGNYQRSYELNAVTQSAMLCTFRLITTIFANLTWVQIVHYMLHNYRKTTHRWVPRWLDTNSKRVQWLGSFLCLSHAIIWGLNLFLNVPVFIPEIGEYRRTNLPLYIPHIAFESLLFLLFAISLCYYLYHDLGHSLMFHRQNREHHEDESVFTKLRLICQEYLSTIPVIVYNLVVFALYLVCFFVNTIKYHSNLLWLFTLTTFLRLLITVNTWGLIGILERRERVVSKQTVLGRKINNKDRFFADPYSNTDYRGDSVNGERRLQGVAGQRIGMFQAETAGISSVLSKMAGAVSAWFCWCRAPSSPTAGEPGTPENMELQHIKTENESVDSGETELERNILFTHGA
ncbi:AEL219Wp [Eremothecium gossypii ATCC 10895]|uniref:AEL219Wp n=1 Tax=Eremothecium gossypii (strain ATCC 10895 / CBS 109.51 / FGSC 9923 / NRRL Y-1056) TaxID=284811 RepID=Q758I1_EREGS|nr:AEL219Wp [Eremothecium gossypii ATCC 10895]AAS52466.1 AEL219Wp [Eremothecium gossypii ATCC 10895]AEY96765.1 FAEL219Wp [Eremothecium gossypii FDAG1]